MPSLATALPDEINRVRELQAQYRLLDGMPNVMAAPAIAMMERSLQNAIGVLGSGDVIGMMRAYEDLKGFSE